MHNINRMRSTNLTLGINMLHSILSMNDCHNLHIVSYLSDDYVSKLLASPIVPYRFNFCNNIS